MAWLALLKVYCSFLVFWVAWILWIFVGFYPRFCPWTSMLCSLYFHVSCVFFLSTLHASLIRFVALFASWVIEFFSLLVVDFFDFGPLCILVIKFRVLLDAPSIIVGAPNTNHKRQKYPLRIKLIRKSFTDQVDP